MNGTSKRKAILALALLAPTPNIGTLAAMALAAREKSVGLPPPAQV